MVLIPPQRDALPKETLNSQRARLQREYQRPCEGKARRSCVFERALVERLRGGDALGLLALTLLSQAGVWILFVELFNGSNAALALVSAKLVSE
jgi:hypothetical protein